MKLSIIQIEVSFFQTSNQRGSTNSSYFKNYFLLLLLLFSTHFGIAQHTEHFRPDARPDEIELRTLLFQTDPTKEPVERTVQVIDGYVIVEGDIILGLEKDLFGPSRGAVITNSGTNRWPNGTIPYEIEAGYPDVNMINYAINHLINNSNICMVPHTNEANYVKFINAQGCSSNVGMVGGEQTINLSPNCGISSTVHEVLHAAGFWHEQSRADRNTYVTINVANILPANAFNFDQYNDGMDIGAYDYGSIMHYGPDAFSSNGMATITINIPPGTASSNIGQRVGLSAGDVSAINMLYPNDAGCGTINVPANLTIRSLGTCL
ncbi:MAG: M12 family metallopeptidase [Saprospiraceae bacterium]|nr:M12 family metallopeptidase [Saprospiraceae bacterium]